MSGKQGGSRLPYDTPTAPSLVRDPRRHPDPRAARTPVLLSRIPGKEPKHSRSRYSLRVTSADTDADARAVQLDALRRLGGAARVEQALSMSEEARSLSIAGLVGRSRAVSPEEARAIVLRRILGDELYEAAYGDRHP